MIYILTGEVHSGKTTFLKKIVRKLKVQKIKLDGFISERIAEKNQIIGYDLIDLKEERSTPFIRQQGSEEWQKVGPYFIVPQGLDEAQKIIRRSEQAELLVADEVGPLELEGKGLWPALKDVIFVPLKKSLLVVRRNILADFLKNLGESKVKILDRKDKRIFSRLLKEIQNNEN